MALSSSQQWKNVVVGIGKANSVKVAEFFSCIVDYFSPKENSVYVNCELVDNILCISSTAGISCQEQLNPPTLSSLAGDANVIGPVVLQHSPECPLRNLTEGSRLSINETLSERKHIALAVAVLLESQDGKLLMTQRAEHMRSFPRAWVPPGGHLERDEQLATCGLRELHEETGLLFPPDDIKLHVLCMWESVYPPFEAFGSPRNHHVVVYLYLKSKETSVQLMKKIKCDPSEVMAYTWFTIGTVQNLQSGKEEYMDVHLLDASSPSGTSQITRKLSSMFRGAVFWTSGEIYSGTQMALLRWCQINKGINSKI